MASSMGAEMIDVWVEIFGDDLTTTTTVKSTSGSYFRLGKTSLDAFLAADLMRKAQESRKAVESAVLATTRATTKTKVQDGALAKLQAIKGHTSTMVESDVTLLVFLNDGGGEFHVSARHLFPANRQSLVGEASDLTALTYMEEPNVLRSLHQRYSTHNCYTNIASILVAINPYKQLGIYGAESMKRYRDRNDRSLSPHIFASAEVAYSELNRPFSIRRQPGGPINQSIIVCGESGSGKTESSKHLMRYLANRSHGEVYDDDDDDDDSRNHERLIERQVLEANHILEAFGNANTILNHNSSRFGKFTRLYFATDNINAGSGEVVGASTTTYLLEKSRLVRQNAGERNFHVFYQLLQGLNTHQQRDLRVQGRGADTFHYTRQGDCFEVDGIDDCKWFINLIKAMGVLGISETERASLFSILAGILYLGNINFALNAQQAAVITPESEPDFNNVAFLFGLCKEEALLRKRLTTVRIKTPGEWIEKNLSVDDAVMNRDSIAKSLYSNVFRWIVNQVNKTLSNTQKLPWIGILDVFGFESFQNNSFEQFCINYANEMLQQHFNQEILLSEQKEYAKESILWTPMNVPDNQATIDLISDGRVGILAQLDSACRMRGTTLDAFVDSVVKQHQRHDRFGSLGRAARLQNVRHGFAIEHYAGKVTYNAQEFMIKNNDSEDPDTVVLFAESSLDVIKSLFAPDDADDDEPDAKKGAPRRIQSRFSSVGSTFKKQLGSLIETLSSTSAYFVRCVKPNTEKRSWLFDLDYVRPQLRCGGLVEAVRMLKVGFPTRVSFDAVYLQYSPLLNPTPKTPLNRRDFSQAVLFLFGLRRNEYMLGLTKVFFRAGKRAFLETVMNRDEKLSQKDMSALIGFINRKRWQRGIATVKSTVLVWRGIRISRLLDGWRAASRLLLIYQRTLLKFLRRGRRRIALRTIQAGLACYVAACQAMGSLRKAKREAERLEQLRKQQKEEEEQERLRQEQQRRRQVEEEEAKAHREPAPIEAAVIRPRLPSRVSTRPEPTPAGPVVETDHAHVQHLEGQITSLQQQLSTANAEIARLKDVVDQLDDINNRLVEDLMTELVLRTQFQDDNVPTERASMSMMSPSPPSSPRLGSLGNILTDTSVDDDHTVEDGFKASGGYAPSTPTGPSSWKGTARRTSRRQQSDCSIQ